MILIVPPVNSVEEFDGYTKMSREAKEVWIKEKSNIIGYHHRPSVHDFVFKYLVYQNYTVVDCGDEFYNKFSLAKDQVLHFGEFDVTRLNPLKDRQMNDPLVLTEIEDTLESDEFFFLL